ncbi:MAG: FAD-dependent monooxygenase [Deltaproteobacteria bacterium]|nr:FAD-dependent monooxygenase [Deltaproteobacteria bacterium]MBW2447218.1 FAD-dependent monooxygenase [Deltaproteobacteria bacterium]
MGSVVIVGAGPAGAVLAYLLASRGIETTLVERQDDFAREFRGEVLLPGGLEPFHQMGLWDRLESVPQVKLTQGDAFVHGRLVASFSFEGEEFGPYAPRWMSQPGLLEMLVAEAEQHPSLRFLRGSAVTELVEENGRFVGVRVRSHGAEEEIRADLVVGADGRTSMVRRRAGFEVDEDPTPMDIVWCKVPMLPSMADPPRARFYAGHGHLLIAAPVYDGTVQLGWVIRKGSFGEIRQRGMPECLDAMAEHVDPELAAHLRRHREDSIAPFLLSTVSDRVREWVRPGVLVIGDAAHTMSPVGAQGLNLAIRDAVVAANHLVPVLSGDAAAGSVDAAARAVEAERSREIRVTQRAQRMAPFLVLRDGWLNRAFFGAVRRTLGRRPRRVRAGRAFLRAAMGVDEVKLRV